jgi:biopolymer transport protein ExbD
MELTVRRSRLARHLHKHEHTEINLTSMIDMMTILVFFLLVHGGFVRLALLELNLPSAQSQATAEPQNLELEITVRSSGIEIGDRTAGLLTRIEKTDQGYDFALLRDYLVKLKAQFRDKTDATLLLEPDIPYDVLVAVMDRVRVAEQVDTAANRVLRTDLFPDISIGDAPVRH